ncbi:MAG: hypothetical protein ABI678_07595 [Kofleriaceae bacterium]
MRALVLATVMTACSGEVDPEWQLDHDRVIAVRMTPPHLAAGETATIDVMLGRKGAPPEVVDPATATVESPVALMPYLRRSTDGHWSIAAASDADLAAARTELGVADGDPVPVSVRMVLAYEGLIAHKLVYMGDHADNPALGAVLVDGVDATGETSLSVTEATKISLSVDFAEPDDVTWLTSCGTMHDYDLPTAYLRVEPEDPHEGTLGVVVRDTSGGVVWQFWPISAP